MGGIHAPEALHLGHERAPLSDFPDLAPFKIPSVSLRPAAC
jgi:hypothetical protein